MVSTFERLKIVLFFRNSTKIIMNRLRLAENYKNVFVLEAKKSYG